MKNFFIILMFKKNFFKYNIIFRRYKENMDKFDYFKMKIFV